MKIILHLLGSYITIVTIALLAGMFWPEQMKLLNPWSTLFLQIIFFLSSLKLDTHAIIRGMREWKAIALVNINMLVVFPIVTFFIARSIVPDYASALVLLAAMPAGMTSALFTDLVGGATEFALVLSATTSLLGTITIPLIIQILLGSSITLPTGKIFLTLVYVFVIPFLFAQIVRHIFHDRIKTTFFTFKPISLVLLGCLIAGIIAMQAGSIQTSISQFIPAIIVLCIFFGLLHVVGYWTAPWLEHRKRLATTVCLTYMNFTLAIYLSGTFFPESSILIPVILSVFPWSLSLIPFQLWARRSS
ncbi:MAG: bile acid:sodium symporter [Patescibacteria group bacterium]